MKKLLLLTILPLMILGQAKAQVATKPVAPVASKTLYDVFSPVFGYQKLGVGSNSAVRQLVDNVVDAHNARFDANGRLLAGDPRGVAFSQTQESILSELHKRLAIKPLMSIKNNMIKDLDTDVSILVDESQAPVALVFQYKKYDENSRKHLRVRPLRNLNFNNTLQQIEKTPSVAIRSKVGDVSNGGEIQIVCLGDLKSKAYKTVTVKITKDAAGKWGVFYQNTRISVINLGLWLNLLSGNGGIKSVTINSQQSVALGAF